jgi:hypothetical protein
LYIPQGEEYAEDSFAEREEVSTAFASAVEEPLSTTTAPDIGGAAPAAQSAHIEEVLGDRLCRI